MHAMSPGCPGQVVTAAPAQTAVAAAELLRVTPQREHEPREHPRAKADGTDREQGVHATVILRRRCGRGTAFGATAGSGAQVV